MKNKAYSIIFLVSLILTFAIGPLRACTFDFFEDSLLYVGVLVRGIIFFVLTIYFLVKYGDIVKPYKIVLLVLFADLVPDIIVRILMGHFVESLPSFPDTILQFIVVLSAWWYTHLSKMGKVTLALSNLLICIGVSSCGFTFWNELSFVKNTRFDTLATVEILKSTDYPLLPDSITNKIQGKNVIVYIGGEKNEKNKVGLSFLQKVYEEFRGNENVAVLSLIYCDMPEDQAREAQLSEDTEFPVVYVDRNKSQLKSSDIYKLYVVDTNKKIRYREKIQPLESNDKQKEERDLQFLKKLMNELN